jgi:hypothetical protein
VSFQREYGIISSINVNRFAWIPACAGTTRRENRERQEDKLEMTGDMRMTCYYDVLVDSGLIGKIDFYLSFLRRQESSQGKIIDKDIERFIIRAIIAN